MILITGASGKSGLHIISALGKRGTPCRGLVRNEAGAGKAEAAGAAECLIGDLTSAAIWHRALVGVDAVYLICPNMHPLEATIARTLFAAAREQHVNHLVYHSVLHPQTRSMPHHWQKLQVEMALLRAHIPFTILQPTAYMQNLLANQDDLLTTGRLRNPYPAEARISLVDLVDVAEAAAVVLTEPGHVGATYELVGTAPLSQHQVAGELAAVLKRPVAAEEIPLAEWRRRAAATLPPYAVDTLARMFTYYTQFGLVGNSNVLRHLLGRPPTTLAAFAQRTLL